MTLPTFTDLGVAASVVVLALVPAALAVLAVAGLLQATRLDTRLEALLGPRGLRATGFLAGLALLGLFVGQSRDWAAATPLKPLCAALAEPWYSGETAVGPARLEVRRRVIETTYWTTISADRYQAVDAATNAVLAEADELWIDAGRSRYRCGVASGPLPRKGLGAPTAADLATFLDRARRGGA